MARKKKKGSEESRWRVIGNLQEETRLSVFAIVFFVLAIFLVFSAWGQAGSIGTITFNALDSLLGVGFVFLPLSLIFIGAILLRPSRPEVVVSKIVGSVLFFISALSLTSLVSEFTAGGIIGNLIAKPLNHAFDLYVSFIVLLALIIISFLLIFDTRLSIKPISFAFFRRSKDIDEYDIDTSGVDTQDDDDGYAIDEPEEEYEEEDSEPEEEYEEEEEDALAPQKQPIAFPLKEYIPPPLSLLNKDSGRPDVGDIKASANIIKRTLQTFGITVEMDEITVGPSITRFAIKPAEGVKLARIVALQRDLSLALAAHPIRIEAPIPGKSLVGIEVPNTGRSTVGLASLIASPEFKESDKPLLLTLGKGISGQSFFANLAKLPHVLIAGATGSGKSVTIHALIVSLLYRNAPENLRFIMVDPKRVELTLYNKIPHLLTPVITDSKKAILALKWAAKEMDRRYDILEESQVRDISSYHENIVAPAYKKKNASTEKLPERMPYIVVIIDELADIMTAYPRELESAIVRLAQMSRAVGIHLILSTQRPSVNVITGLIKANVPARIALQVSSQVDSRTILDMSGAEKLLGAGDMLYLSGEMSQPRRIQSAFVSETEVKKVAKYLTKEYEDEVPSEIDFTSAANGRNSLQDAMTNDTHDDDDDLYEEARETVMHAGKASTSYLQRKLKVGYARAARLMDMLEERGVIGPAEGSKPREVLEGRSDGYSSGYGRGEQDDYDTDSDTIEDAPIPPRRNLDL